MRLVFLLTLLAACASGTARREPRAGDEGTKLVTEVWTAPRPDLWRNSKWYRPFDDISTPATVIISNLWACVLGYPDVNEPRPGKYYRCPSGWRPPRG